MKNAVIYARFSSHGQNEQTIDGQVRICREYAENMGFNVIKVYEEKARTGTNDSRPAFQQMIKDAVSETFQYIIVYMLDRFARNRRDSIMYKEMLKQEHGIKVLSATQQISDDEGGEFYEMFLEWNDERYSKRLSKRIHLGFDTSIANGTFTGGPLIYGYRLIDTEHKGKKGTIHRVAVDEHQAEIVRYVFTEYANGTNKIDIAKALNARGERIHSRQFHSMSFDKWLVNYKYTGKYYHGKRLCDHTYPRIIDDRLFDRVQKRLAENRHLAGTKHAKKLYLLTGKAFCGYCHSPIVADGGTSKTGQRYYYYVCKGKQKKSCHKSREDKDQLEKLVTISVQDFLSDKENAEQVADDTIAYYEKRTGDDGLRSLDSRIVSITQEITEMTTAFIKAKNPLLQAGIEKKMDEYQILLTDLQNQKAQILLERGQNITKAAIMKYVADLVQGNPDDKDYQRKLIDNLVIRVAVYDDGVVPYLNVGMDKYIQNVRLLEITERFQAQSSVPEQTAVLHHKHQFRNNGCY